MTNGSEWVPAYEALKMLTSAEFTAHSAMRTICERANAGLIRARANLFTIDEKEQSELDIPKEFWWAKGKAALEQNWRAGDFSTWIDRSVHLQAYGVSFSKSDLIRLLPSSYDGSSKKTESQTNDQTKRAAYIAPERIEELKSASSDRWDTRKLVQLCDEMNSAHSSHNYISVALLARALIDHVPPIFGQESFGAVVAQYGTKSFKASMVHLDKSMRKIADDFLHGHIRSRETLPNENTVDVKRDLDVLLGEVIRIL